MTPRGVIPISYHAFGIHTIGVLGYAPEAFSRCSHQRWYSPMCTCMQPSAVVVLCATTLFLLPQIGADDRNEPDDGNQETVRIGREFARKVEKYNTLLKQGCFDEAIEVGKVAQLLH